MVITDAQTGQAVLCSVFGCGTPAYGGWFETTCAQLPLNVSTHDSSLRWFCREHATAYSVIADAGQGVRAF